MRRSKRPRRRAGIVLPGHSRKFDVCSILHERKYCAAVSTLLQRAKQKPKLHHRWWALSQCEASSRAVFPLMTHGETVSTCVDRMG
eukprot:scaffold3292_cov43-Attheya_sp.AAC.2